MALQDSITTASIALTRAQYALDSIFDSVTGPRPTNSNEVKRESIPLNMALQAQDLAERMEQFESQLQALGNVLISPQTATGGASLGSGLIVGGQMLGQSAKQRYAEEVEFGKAVR